MNILFFLTPKSSVSCVEETDTLRQVIEKMEVHGYTAVPLLSGDGRYLGTLTEGDVLRKLKGMHYPDQDRIENVSVLEVGRKRDIRAVHVDVKVEELFERVMNQNFVPVVDDGQIFIGIVTRKDVIAYLVSEWKKASGG